MSKQIEVLTDTAEACLGKGIDVAGLDAFLDYLFRLSANGQIGCAWDRGTGVDVMLSPPGRAKAIHHVKLPLAKTKMRMLCARLAVRCAEWSGRDVFPYGDHVRCHCPVTNRPCEVEFQNKNDAAGIVILQAPAQPVDEPSRQGNHAVPATNSSRAKRNGALRKASRRRVIG